MPCMLYMHTFLQQLQHCITTAVILCARYKTVYIQLFITYNTLSLVVVACWWCIARCLGKLFCVVHVCGVCVCVCV